MPSLSILPTPALVLDRGILDHNLARMREALARHQVRLRPHLKTAKSHMVATHASKHEFGGITVSTIAEALYFAEHGFEDILLAVGITPDKLPRLEPLTRRGIRPVVLTDRLDVARAIAGDHPMLRAMIEIDCGEHRSGLLPDDSALLEIATTLGRSFAGVLTHAGYRGSSPREHAQVAEQERSAVVDAAERLRAAGREVQAVSMGSTPTTLFAESLEGITEVRAGVYMFGDLFQAAIGSCTEEEIAVTVLATVIGHRVEDGILLLDVGALALSKDRSTANTDRDAGFGLVWDIDGKPSYGRAYITRVYQEHGLAVCEAKWPWDQLPIGSRVRIAPNHACLTAAQHDVYQVVDGGREVIAEWERCRGW